MVFLRKLRATFNSSSNSLLSIVGARKTSGSTYIASVSLTYFIFSFSICALIKTSAFFSSFFLL
jgi:hypothetical protein